MVHESQAYLLEPDQDLDLRLDRDQDQYPDQDSDLDSDLDSEKDPDKNPDKDPYLDHGPNQDQDLVRDQVQKLWYWFIKVKPLNQMRLWT